MDVTIRIGLVLAATLALLTFSGTGAADTGAYDAAREAAESAEDSINADATIIYDDACLPPDAVGPILRCGMFGNHCINNQQLAGLPRICA